DWGAQRVKGLSIRKLIASALAKPFHKKDEKVETSLIEEFYYPKYGPGQLWERLAEIDLEMGAELRMNREAVKIHTENGVIRSVTVRNTDEGSPDFGKEETIECDVLISSMPIKDLIGALPDAPNEIKEISEHLPYRDFITVGLLLDRLELKNKTKLPTVNGIVPDCWIYIQERDVKIGRLQIFNNWSPYMVDDVTEHVWIGLEYFCYEGDELWSLPEEKMIETGINELQKIGIIQKEHVLDGFTTKVKKAYPGYFGVYERFDRVRDYLDGFPNLFCIGRNGQHRYNNMDHSMLTAIRAAEQILSGKTDKNAVWSVNTEKEYHETAKKKE
ncbi:MAG: FAD-dependent oxidoreductase, partial [Eubacterium sp.]|nr:FAD-dependent oxidoreductase [Eubacterium sp.]